MLLFRIILHEATAHLQTLGKNIYMRKSSSKKFVYSKSTIETLNSKYTRTTFYCIYCKLWAYFIPFSTVLPVDFEQVNVCWVSPYQFINAEITYCRNYWQMYKNLSEIEVHKKRVWSKVVAPKKMFFLVGYCVQSQGTVFFRVQCFFISQKQLRLFIPQWIRYFLEERLQP